MQTSEQINELATALAKAQAKLKHASKDAENPHFKSKYADLSSVIEALRPLSDFGLSYAQFPHDAEGGIIVSTLLMHTSGQWLRCDVPIPVSKQDAHGYGSAITYGRRYGLQAICGLAADEDDDGNKAAAATSGQQTRARQRKEAPPAEVPSVDWAAIDTMPLLVSKYNTLTRDEKAAHKEAFDARRKELMEAAQ